MDPLSEETRRIFDPEGRRRARESVWIIKGGAMDDVAGKMSVGFWFLKENGANGEGTTNYTS